jgi:ferredoxin/flavodoxin---NADP+ reductase
MSNIRECKILSVHHWTDRLFSFTATRDAGFRFLSGQFAMIGLRVGDTQIMRAYSMVSPAYAETLEFLSIKAPNGPLTTRLKLIQPGDALLLGAKSSGTLLTSNLLPGRRLYLVSTGTGLAPFMSIIRDPEVYDQYERVVLIHNCRTVDELAYRDLLASDLRTDEWIGEAVAEKLIYLPMVSREPFDNMGRVTDRMRDGTLFETVAMPPPSLEEDRFMVCGSPQMLADFCQIMDEWGFREGNSNRPGQFVIERAFVDK